MATELFITKGWFTDEMQSAGQDLVNELDKSEGAVSAAFWILEPEKKWELVIVSNLVTTDGPRRYYQRINDINNKSDKSIISLHDIRVLSERSRVFIDIMDNFSHGFLLQNTRLGSNFIGDLYVEDMFIYKLDMKLISNHRAEQLNYA
jgi:hypothetical protein